MRNTIRSLSLGLLAFASAACLAIPAHAADLPAVVHKRSVEVRAAPDFESPAITTLGRDAPVAISAQKGLWYQLALDGGRSGYVRINEVRVVPAGQESDDDGRRALFQGTAGKGRVTETATVRGIDASVLAAGRHDAAGLARLEAHRVDAGTAAAHARAQGWQARSVPLAGEAQELDVSGTQATQADKRSSLRAARGLLSKLGGGMISESAGSRIADRAIGKSNREIAEEERAFGPAVSARMLGAAPLWNDDAAQRRVNLIGRWVASQTSRPDLPWTFGIIDDGEINAYAAPGGYILLTRGLYGLLADDAEVAAVIAHELGHVVQRDHFEVIRRQQVREAGKDVALSQVSAPGAAAHVKDYIDRHGAAVLLTDLDREAEYRADAAAGVYLQRAGFDPLAFYSVLQKMASFGSRPARLAQLYRTHPPLDERMDRLDRGGGRDGRR
ncbi:M48 family metalloprotease [Luteimonas sp. MJ204]|uniref:M48 family metalloprotease n=1 Tax=Luteimonas TaxID=83614 RepID=UPI0031BAA8DD